MRPPIFTRQFKIAVEMQIVEIELIVRRLWRRLLIVTLIGFLIGVLIALTYTLP